MGSSYLQMDTRRGHLSTANTIIAASSRLDVDEIQDSAMDKTAVSSQLDLTKSKSSLPRYSITMDSTMSTRNPSWINSRLNLRHIDVVVLLTCFITGLTDTATFASKHKVDDYLWSLKD